MPIIVNKVEISDDVIHNEMQYHEAGSLEEARHKASESLVIKELLVQEARHFKLLDSDEKDDIDSAVDALLQQEISVPNADEEMCQRYYEQNLERFMDKKTDKQLPFDMVHNYIRDYLHTRSLQMGISQYIKILSGKAKIAGFSFEGADSPLVQ